MMNKQQFLTKLEEVLRAEYCTTMECAQPFQLHNAISKVVMYATSENWEKSRNVHSNTKQACYFSAEFLMGRMVFNNLYCVKLLDTVKEILAQKGIDINTMEDIEDDALGNGGLGRLAACFIDSAATQNIPLNGYGIRYKYGIFKQTIENGFQKEYADNWTVLGDPWSIRRDDKILTVTFADQVVKAVPYDMPIYGYDTKNTNTLRLWQAEALEDFDFTSFNDQEYAQSVILKNNAENITKVLYPNDSTDEGKTLRLKQQYFFSSASLQDILNDFTAKHGNAFETLGSWYAVQLNDTHPVVAIPELIRLLTTNHGLSFEKAFAIAKQTFAYTNHTVMAEALEKWSVALFSSILPEVYEIVVKIDAMLTAEFKAKNIDTKEYKIIDGTLIHMARLAIYATSYINGVAAIHTEILKDDVLKEWYAVYPERFQNKTNGITQRRWLGLCNPELSSYITGFIGENWLTNLDALKELESKANDNTVIEKFNAIKMAKKQELVAYIEKYDNVKLDPNFIFDIQIKRLHEYKRQLMNAFSILAIYFGIKDGSIKDFTPTAFIFGAKAAPGYIRAKGIIKFINEIANLVNNDPQTKDKLSVVFVSNYNVSYAEKLVTAADVSEQISTAGTEASGTGNMKFMLNGAVTLGTLDGANVEIVEQVGTENAYIFGATVEEIHEISKNYDAKAIYQNNPMIKKVLDTLVDGTFSDENTGMFKELYTSLLEGASWHKADHYFLLQDLPAYIDAKLRCNQDYKNRTEFGRKCWINMANAGKFSSDRTIKQYAAEIWNTPSVSI